MNHCSLILYILIKCSLGHIFISDHQCDSYCSTEGNVMENTQQRSERQKFLQRVQSLLESHFDIFNEIIQVNLIFCMWKESVFQVVREDLPRVHGPFKFKQSSASKVCPLQKCLNPYLGLAYSFLSSLAFGRNTQHSEIRVRTFLAMFLFAQQVLLNKTQLQAVLNIGLRPS